MGGDFSCMTKALLTPDHPVPLPLTLLDQNSGKAINSRKKRVLAL